MGCACGKLVPSEEYHSFRVSVAPENDEDPDMLRWTGLTVELSDETQIECIGVVLYDFGPPHEIEPLVDVIGVTRPSYEELFPGRIEAYEQSLSQF